MAFMLTTNEIQMIDEWKDIAIAPKDKVILALWNGHPFPTCWFPGEPEEYKEVGFWIFKHRVISKPMKKAKWKFVIATADGWVFLHSTNPPSVEPTHWTELEAKEENDARKSYF